MHLAPTPQTPLHHCESPYLAQPQLLQHIYSSDAPPFTRPQTSAHSDTMTSSSETFTSALLAALLQHPLYLILSLGLAYFTGSRVKEYHRLRHFKGPFSTGISWIWHSRAVISGDSHMWYGHATDKYGIIHTSTN